MATHDLRNWLKLTILTDKACVGLRQVFLKLWRTRFGHEWSGADDDINMVLEQRQMRRIGKMQRETIRTGKVDSWDLTTLRAILTSRDFLNLTAKEATNINYLSNIRNKLAHSASKGITDDELNASWCKASAILVEFGESEAELELLKQESRVSGVEFMRNEEPINDVSTLEARRIQEEGNAQFMQENWGESIIIYTQAILLHGIPSPDRATLYSNRAVAFLKQKKTNLALEDAKKAIELWPEWWRGHYRMGQVYTEMNKYENAEACFDEAYTREPDQEEIKVGRSYVRMKIGQKDRNDKKSSNGMIHTFKASGVEEWELENGKTATGLSMKERIERFHCQSDPYMAAYIKQRNGFLENVTKNKEDIYTRPIKFKPEQLEKFAKSSVYARELRKAQYHSFEAVLAMKNLGHSEPFPLPLCEKFITELSSCAKIDIMVAQLPVELHRRACSIVDYLLKQKTTFDEDTRICYYAMNATKDAILNQESPMFFLSECIRKYPLNAYFLRSRGLLNSVVDCYEDGIRDINAAIKLDQSRYEYLLDRAGMMRLLCPKVTAQASIEAYKEFLAVAPEDHRFVPRSYYGMAELHLEIAKASVKPNKPQSLDLTAAKHFFNLGVEAERKQLPFFLPYSSALKTVVERRIQSMSLFY